MKIPTHESWGSVHPSTQKFENTVLFLRLDLPSTLIHREKTVLFLLLGLPSTLIRHELFETALQTAGIWKHRLYVPEWTENIFKTELFENDYIMTII